MSTDAATRSIDDLPGPRRLPLLGNAHQVRGDCLHAVAEEWCERYGPVFRFDLGLRQVVGVGEIEAINAILRERPEGFRRWSALKVIIAEIGDTGFDGVFSAEGDDWRRQRRLAVTALNSNHLQRYFHVVRTCTERLHSRLQEAAHSGRTLDITDELTSYTVDVTSALAFGHDLNTLERRDSELQGHIQRVFQMIGRRLAAPVPYWRWVRLPADRALDRSFVEIRSAVEGFIEQARERVAQRPELREFPENFLEGMLAAQETDGSFTDDEIVANTITLLNAGEDTTAHTMAWAVWLLASSPEIQARWGHEALQVLGEHPFPVSYESVESLRYGEAVIRESMRLKSVAPVLFLESIVDATVGGAHIPAGTRLLLLTRYAGLQAGALERTSEFDPGRWLGDGEQTAPDQKSFLPFGAGPRFCPGRNLALLESKAAMAMIARNFEIALDESHGPVTERFTFTMVPQGLRVRLRERVPEKATPVGAPG